MALSIMLLLASAALAQGEENEGAPPGRMLLAGQRVSHGLRVQALGVTRDPVSCAVIDGKVIASTIDVHSAVVAGVEFEWSHVSTLPGLVVLDSFEDAGGEDEVPVLSPDRTGGGLEPAWVLMKSAQGKGTLLVSILDVEHVWRADRRVQVLKLECGAPQGVGIALSAHGVAVGLAVSVETADAAYGICYDAAQIQMALELPRGEGREEEELEALCHAVRGTAAIEFDAGEDARRSIAAAAGTLTRTGHPWHSDLVGRVLVSFLEAGKGAYCEEEVMPPLEKLAPDGSELRVLRGILLFSLERMQEAEACVRESLDSGVTGWHARKVLLEIAVVQGAEELPEGVLPLPQMSCPLRYRGDIGAGLAVYGAFRQAVDLLEGMVETDLCEPGHLWAMGGALGALGRGREAIRFLEAVLLDPEATADHFLECATVCAREGLWTRAEELLDIALERGGEIARIHAHRGYARAMQGDVSGAREDLRVALALDPEYPSAWLFQGRLALTLGEIDKVAESLRALDRLDPESAAILREEVESRGK